MQKFTGIKLNFSPTGEATITKGEVIMPHRIDLIRNKLDSGDLENIENMFFCLDVPDCKNNSKREHIVQENGLFLRYLKLSDPNVIDLYPNTGFSPEAA